MLKLSHLLLCVVALPPMAAIAQAPMSSVARTETVEQHAEEAAIEHVMKQFHDAVVAHDGAALSGLFLPDANIWLNVLTNAAYDRAQAKAANTSKVRASQLSRFREVRFDDAQGSRPGAQQHRHPYGWNHRSCVF